MGTGAAAQIEIQRVPFAPARSIEVLLDSPLEFVDSFPDPRAMTDQQLLDLINVLTDEEQETEYLRGVAQRKVLILRAELTRRSGGDDQPG
jgi:hypothetical protein